MEGGGTAPRGTRRRSGCLPVIGPGSARLLQLPGGQAASQLLALADVPWEYVAVLVGTVPTVRSGTWSIGQHSTCDDSV